MNLPPLPASHPFPFDPAYGYDLDRLLRVGYPPPPDDFAAFWRATHEEARAVPLRLERREVASPHPDFLAWEVEFDGLGGGRVGGWLTQPRAGAVTEAAVLGHGYGGRETPDCLPGTVAIQPCARGFNRSAAPGLPGVAARHVLHGIGDRAAYLHRFCAADLWSAASALLELFPEGAARLHYRGVSFGGGMGALAVPWDPRFRRAFLDVPSFGNHPLRLTLPCVGSGEAVRSWHRRHPEAKEVLAYFDAATAASFMTVPVLVAAARFDPAVPPPGQFAVHNAVPAAWRGLFLRTTGHFPHPAQAAEDAALEAHLNLWPK